MTNRPALLIHDDSFPPNPRGYPAFSYDAGNTGLPHPLPEGVVVRTRDLGEDDTAEWLARIGVTELGAPGVGSAHTWVYWLLPTDG